MSVSSDGHGASACAHLWSGTFFAPCRNITRSRTHCREGEDEQEGEDEELQLPPVIHVGGHFCPGECAAQAQRRKNSRGAARALEGFPTLGVAFGVARRLSSSPAEAHWGARVCRGVAGGVGRGGSGKRCVFLVFGGETERENHNFFTPPSAPYALGTSPLRPVQHAPLSTRTARRRTACAHPQDFLSLIPPER